MGTSDSKTANGESPEGVTDLSKRSWIDGFKRTLKAFKAYQLTIWAASLTYFGVLSIFPAQLVMVSILGMLGDSVTVLLVLVSLLLAVSTGARPNVKLPFRLDLARQPARGARLGAGVDRLRVLRLELQLLQQDLRCARRPDRVPAVALDHEHLRPARADSTPRSSAAARSRPARSPTRSEQFVEVRDNEKIED